MLTRFRAGLKRSNAGETNSLCRDPASFRDPSGFVFQRNGIILRQVNACYAEGYNRLIDSGLYEELLESQLLVPHEEAALDERFSDDAYRVLQPESLALVSYPYEWCFSQLRDAALATLQIERRALARGMTLKDASAYNMQLHGGRPTLIDTLSLERYEEGKPWGAYRQFCQHFLAPLALMSRADARLSQLLRIHLDGVPLDLAARLLPLRTKFNLSLGLHIHAHARSQERSLRDVAIRPARSLRLSRKKRLALLASLESAIEGLTWKPPQTAWSNYYESNNNYGAAGLNRKEQVVREFLQSAGPKTVWALGANDGRFGRVAIQCGAQMVAAWDLDAACVEMNYCQMIARCETAMHPLVLDITNPTPGIGWANEERKSFVDRGPADAVLALGLVHHLAIANNVPLEQIAAYFAKLGRWAIVEWVPKHDSQVQRMLADRVDVFPDYDMAAFESALRKLFRIERACAIEGTERSLYLVEAI